MKKTQGANWLLLWWLAVIWTTTSAASTQGGPLVLTAKDSGRSVDVKVGQSLTVDLDLGAGQHVVTPEFNSEVLTLVGQSLQSMSGPQGTRSRLTYQFLVRREGRTELTIAARGQKIKGKDPGPLFKVTIVAGGGTMI